MADGASANPGDPPSPASARSGQRKHVPDWLNSPIWHYRGVLHEVSMHSK
ncbi:hypothetical protein OsI_15581 [Oryza sativa Indica Group]|uniref:Uncharacterized protein n=1 Tax=Oryza sativa subsp. indica TaxID=39946 RepID=B8AT09_ORYSI|nr:hypothetical protein OsI_15581 [Oryza sativa Indica Group]